MNEQRVTVVREGKNVERRVPELVVEHDRRLVKLESTGARWAGVLLFGIPLLTEGVRFLRELLR